MKCISASLVENADNYLEKLRTLYWDIKRFKKDVIDHQNFEIAAELAVIEKKIGAIFKDISTELKENEIINNEGDIDGNNFEL